MAGRAPFRSKLEARVSGLGGDDVVFSWVRDGKTIRWIGQQMGCSRDYVYTWLDWKEGRRAAFAKARKDSAPSLLEDGYELLEDAAGDALLTPSQASLIKEQAGFKKFMAGAFERGSISEKANEVNVNLSFGSLHLEALKAAGRMQIAPPVQELLPAEVVTDDA